MKCSNCGFENTMGAKFCEKCGTKMPDMADAALMPEPAPTPVTASEIVFDIPSEAPTAPVRKPKSKKKFYIIIAAVLCVALLVGVGIWLFADKIGTSASDDNYDKQVDIGYDLLDQGKYEEAIVAFDKAIKIDDKKPEAYIGKATAMAHDDEMDYIKADEIIELAEAAYEKTGDADVLLHLKEVAAIVGDNGFETECIQIMNAYFANYPEEALDQLSDEERIFMEFRQADNFYWYWMCSNGWLFDVNDMDGETFYLAISSVEINTINDLEKEFKKHYTTYLSDRFIKGDLKAAEKGGELYIRYTGGTGGYNVNICDYSLQKKSETKYVMVVKACYGIYDDPSFEYDYDKNTGLFIAPEKDLTYHEILCEYVNNTWVFADYKGVDKNTGEKYGEWFGSPIIPGSEEESYYDRMQEIAEYSEEIYDTAFTQSEMNSGSYNIYKKYDDLLNEIYKYLEGVLSPEDFKLLEKDELEWIKEKEKAVEEAGKEVEGGTMQPLMENSAAAKYTEERCWYLISLIP